MTSSRAIWIAVAVFAVLLAAVLLTHKSPYESTAAKVPSLPVIAKDGVDKIELASKEGTYTFEKKGNDWHITQPKDYKADAAFATLLVDKLPELALESVAGTNKDKHKAYEVDAETGLTMTVFNKGQQLLKLIVGKNSADFRSTFVRLPDQDIVYATKKVFGGSLKRKLNDWRDKAMVGLKADALADVAFIDGKTSLHFEKKADAKAEDKKDDTAAEPKEAKDAAKASWSRVGDPAFPLDKSRLDSVLRVLAGLSWSDIVEEPADLATYGLTNPTRRVTYKSDKGESRTLLLGSLDAEKNIAWVMFEGEKAVYQIRKFQYEKFTQDEGFFKGEKTADAPAPTAPAPSLVPPSAPGAKPAPRGVPIPAK